MIQLLNYTFYNFLGVIDINWCEVEDANYAKPFSKLTKVPNLLIASDIVYDNSLFRPLCQTIDYIFDRCQNQCLLILANAIRNENTQKDFFDIIGKFCLNLNNKITSF